MLISLLAGVLTGCLLAIPPGPINFAVFEKSMKGQRRAAFRLAVGAVAGDSFYCLVAIIYQLSTELLELVKIVFSAFGGLFLIGLGVYYIWVRKCPLPAAAGLPPDPRDHPDHAHQGHFITGLLLALSNPFYIVVMIAVTELYYSVGVLYLHMGNNLAFLIGIQAGTFLWLWTIGKFVQLNRHHLGDIGARVRGFCGWAFLGFGLYMTAKFFKLVF